MTSIAVQRLLDRVALRRRLASGLERWRILWLATAAVYLAVLLASRLLGLVPDCFTLPTLAAVPALSLLLALLLQRRGTSGEAARLVDSHLKTKDLFLTAATIDHSLGAYQQLVLTQAAERAAGARPSAIVRVPWRRGAVSAAGSLLALLLGVWLLPQLDPFGRGALRQQRARQHERLRELRQATAARAALLEQQAARTQADPVKQALINLEDVFRSARPEARTNTFARLNEQQKALGELWRQAHEEQLRQAGQTPDAQRFGQHDAGKADQWKKDLERGNAASVARELKEMRELANRVAGSTDPVTQEQLRQELMNRLRDLQEALAQQANSPELNAALQRAMEQLQMSCRNEQCREAMQGVCDSLRLSEAELQQLAKTLSDAKMLEQALRTLQSAKRLNNQQPLNGQDCQKCDSLTDYQELFDQLYAQQMAGMQPGQGEGTTPGDAGSGLGSGQGVGKRPYGDDNAKTAFKPEQASSEYQAGKILMAWKDKGMSESGEARKEYRQAVGAARQEASEALLKEQVPSSYHGAVKTYFDTLQREAAAPEPAPKPEIR